MIFSLSEKEVEEAKEFISEHEHKDVDKGAIGGNISYSFTTTSLGTMCSIKCASCKLSELLDVGQF